jgi:endo-alpha-1,4-polygalactosaminidase (GH114 family)
MQSVTKSGLLVFGLAVGLGHGLVLDRAASLWQPAVNSTWQIILSQTLSISDTNPSVTPNVDVYDIDMFSHQNTTVVKSLQKLNKKVICYFSAGSYEPGRPDSSQFSKSDMGKELDGWPGEYWLNTNSPAIRTIMQKRIQIAAQMGCNAIDPDNVDGFVSLSPLSLPPASYNLYTYSLDLQQNTNGLGLTAADSVSFVKFMASEAAKLGMSTGLKNAGDIISDVMSSVQFCVNEECAANTECSTFTPFINNGKPVYHIEYPAKSHKAVSSTALKAACQASGGTKFSTVVKTLELDNWVEYCDGSTAETTVA